MRFYQLTLFNRQILTDSPVDRQNVAFTGHAFAQNDEDAVSCFNNLLGDFYRHGALINYGPRDIEVDNNFESCELNDLIEGDMALWLKDGLVNALPDGVDGRNTGVNVKCRHGAVYVHL